MLATVTSMIKSVPYYFIHIRITADLMIFLYGFSCEKHLEENAGRIFTFVEPPDRHRKVQDAFFDINRDDFHRLNYFFPQEQQVDPDFASGTILANVHF